MKETKQAKKGTSPAGKSRYRQSASRLGFLKVPEGFKGRWVENDEARINKRLEEGFEFVNKTKLPSAVHEKTAAGKEVKDRSEQGGHFVYRELVGMMIPIEDVRGDGQCLVERQKLMRELADHDFKSRVSTKANQHSILGSTAAGNKAGVTSHMEVERYIYD